MAKKIKFPLILKDNYPARTLDELREHFDLEAILNSYQNGKLLVWLQDRSYDNESNHIKGLNENSENFIEELQKILGISNSPVTNIELEKLTEKQERMAQLKQFTSEEAVLNSLEQVAFNQEELADLLDEGYDTIYLCENQYRIPLNLHNKHYIGIGQVKITLNVKPTIDFEDFNISFTNIALVNSQGKPFEFYSLKQAENLYFSGQAEPALSMFKKLVANNDNRAKAILGEIYMYDYNWGDYNQGYQLVQESAQSNDILGCFFLAENTKNGFKDTYDNLFAPLEAEAAGGDAFALYALASYYEQDGKNKNLQYATEYFHASAKAGYWRAYRDLGWNYKYGRGVNIDYYRSKEYYQKNAAAGDWWSQIQLGELLYYNLNLPEEGLQWYRKGYTPIRMKKAIDNLIAKIDNLSTHFLSNRWIALKDHPDHSKSFSSKSAAFQMMKQEIIMNIDYINNLLFSSDNADELSSQYITDVRNVINSTNLYSQICTNAILINHNMQASIESTIRDSSESLITNYHLSYSDCTYQFSNDDIYDKETPLNINRYDSFFYAYKVFESEDYGLGYQKKAETFEKQINKLVKDLLQPLKTELLKINTEDLA